MAGGMSVAIFIFDAPGPTEACAPAAAGGAGCVQLTVVMNANAVPPSIARSVNRVFMISCISRVRFLARLPAPIQPRELSSRTFWTFAREFSPFEAARGDRCNSPSDPPHGCPSTRGTRAVRFSQRFASSTRAREARSRNGGRPVVMRPR